MNTEYLVLAGTLAWTVVLWLRVHKLERELGTFMDRARTADLYQYASIKRLIHDTTEMGAEEFMAEAFKELGMEMGIKLEGGCE